ncbi:MAG: hypothetical protein JRI23_04020 [Deltaproteobacteria bacterium]|jgi:hypothetical protein|nr:hypothetical protein [Deltaproteobacteria bacterium]MBW2530696.1 hypothetical protein [Deltaproteobacteria bacterium]
MPGWLILRPGSMYTADDIGSRFAFETEADAWQAIEAPGSGNREVPFPLPDEILEGDDVLVVPRRGEGCDEN